MFDYQVGEREICIRDHFGEVETRLGLSYEFYGITQSIAEKFLASLCEHIKNVREAGEMIGVDKRQLQMHDLSKFDLDEFPYYAANFSGGRSGLDVAHDAGKVSDGFAKAWLHHIHLNPHHWQHWIFPDGFTPKGSSVEGGVFAMPEEYALEMIADWMGASKTYTGSWDMSHWLSTNMPKITVHSQTAQFLRDRLNTLGYQNIVMVKHFANGV